MGIDITLYPDKTRKKDLQAFLKSLGFEKCHHLWDWPEGTVNYYWFEHTDYKSTTGVEADIYPLKDGEKLAKGDWAIHVRSNASASYHDVEMINHVLKQGRKKFGGLIDGDFGLNRYVPLLEFEESTPISRGLTFTYNHVRSEMQSIKAALPEPLAKRSHVKLNSNEPKYKKAELFHKLDANRDPSRVIYNGLIPFAVSMFEYFFAQSFKILIKYDNYALKKRDDYKDKVSFQTLLELSRNEIDIEDVIAENYTFQNMNQLNKAYKNWLNIDIYDIFSKKRKVGRSVFRLEKRISEIIEYRHGIIHRFDIDKNLTKEEYINILDSVEKCILEFVLSTEKKYGFTIDKY